MHVKMKLIILVILGNLCFHSVFTACFALWPLAQIEDLILRWLDVCGGVQPDPFRGGHVLLHANIESMCLMTSSALHCGLMLNFCEYLYMCQWDDESCTLAQIVLTSAMTVPKEKH